MNTPRHSVSVAAVITDDHGRALLIQRRDNGKWIVRSEGLHPLP